jgi:hypothetical protein
MPSLWIKENAVKRTGEKIVRITMRQWAHGEWEASVADATGRHLCVVRSLEQLASCLEKALDRVGARSDDRLVPAEQWEESTLSEPDDVASPCSSPIPSSGGEEPA